MYIFTARLKMGGALSCYKYLVLLEMNLTASHFPLGRPRTGVTAALTFLHEVLYHPVPVLVACSLLGVAPRIALLYHVTYECTVCSTAPRTALLYHVTSECTGCSTAPRTALLYHVTSECTGCSTAPRAALLYHVTSECTGCSTAPRTAFSAVSLPTHGVAVWPIVQTQILHSTHTFD